MEDTQEVHVRNPNYKGKNYDPNYQARKTENKQQQQPTMANNIHTAPYTRPAANNNNNLASSSDIAGEVTLKMTVDGYQLLKMNELIKNAAAWRARVPKTGRFDKYFNNKETTNTTPKVQINWAMELEAFNIKFQHVSGKTNILVDTLSRLVDIDPDARLDPENAGWEFGYYVFETLPKLLNEEIVPVCEVLSGTNVIIPDPDLQEPFTQQLTSPLTNDQLQALQAQDEKCTSLIAMLRRGRLDPLVYSINDGILYRHVIEGGQTFQAIYVPRTPPSLI